MKEIRIKVPKEVRFLRDLKNPDGSSFTLPNGILCKGMCGAGATTMALVDEHPTIICSPRQALIESKKAQHDFLAVMEGVTKHDIVEYVNSTDIPKIFTTYDSFVKVMECVDIEKYRTVVDEFHCLLMDSSFKSDVERRFIRILKDIPYVTYVSATPIPAEYLAHIPELRDVDIYTLEWEKKTNVYINRMKSQYPLSVIRELIKEYQRGEYPVIYQGDKEYQSKEVVIFVNSVTDIVNLVGSTQLSPNDVNIIVSNNKENSSVVKQLGKAFEIGKIPNKGEQHKMFTFATSTAYFGCDFYSTNASTYIVSDCSRTHTSVDISVELVQIAGRQRNDENVFRNIINLVYNSVSAPVSSEDYLQEVKEKIEHSQHDLAYYNAIPENRRGYAIKNLMEMQEVMQYQNSLVLYDYDTNEFCINHLKMLADMVRYNAQYVQYQDFLEVNLERSHFIVNGETHQFYYSRNLCRSIVNDSFGKKMQFYCELRGKNGFGAHAVAAKLAKETPVLKIYYDTLGPGKIARLRYDEFKLKDEYQLSAHYNEIQRELRKHFSSGDVKSSDEIKGEIRLIFSRLTIEHKAAVTARMLERFGYKLSEKKVWEGGQRVSKIQIN